MKSVKILSIVTLVVVVGVLGFALYTHFKNNSSNTPQPFVTPPLAGANLNGVVED